MMHLGNNGRVFTRSLSSALAFCRSRRHPHLSKAATDGADVLAARRACLDEVHAEIDQEPERQHAGEEGLPACSVWTTRAPPLSPQFPC